MSKPIESWRLDSLRSALDYNPNDGLFRWKIVTHGYGGAINVGDIAGTSKDGYIQINYRGLHRAHILAYWFMTGEEVPDGYELDHEDRVRSNNRWSNLRLSTRSNNNHNAEPSTVNRSGVKGVSWIADKNAWLVTLFVNKEKVFQKLYKDYNEAVQARLAAEKQYLGVSVEDRGIVVPTSPPEYERPRKHRSWSDPSLRAEQSARTAAWLNTPEGRAGRSEQAKRTNNDPEVKAKISASISALRWVTNGIENKRVLPEEAHLLGSDWRYGKCKYHQPLPQRRQPTNG